jgi:hypothetical protein
MFFPPVNSLDPNTVVVKKGTHQGEAADRLAGSRFKTENKQGLLDT